MLIRNPGKLQNSNDSFQISTTLHAKRWRRALSCGAAVLPQEYAASLRDLLPVEINTNPLIESPEGINQGYHLVPAASATTHPIFRFHSEDKENSTLWNRMKEMYWCFAGVVPKKGAEVLASTEGRPWVGRQKCATDGVAILWCGQGFVFRF